MGNIRVIKPSRDFEQVSGKVIREFSVDTVGIYAKLLALADGWNLNIKGLATAFNVSEARVRKSVGELEAAGYIVRHPRKEGGWQYYIYGNAVAEQDRSSVGSRISEKPQYDKTAMAENPQYDKSRNTENREGYNNIDINNNSIHKDKEQRKKNNNAAQESFPLELLSLGCEPQHIDDWIAARGKAPLTASVIEGLKREAAAAGLTPAQAVRMCAENGWRGFKAIYVKDKTPQSKDGGYCDRTREAARQLFGEGFAL